MDWARILAYVTGLVDQDLLARSGIIKGRAMSCCSLGVRTFAATVMFNAASEPTASKSAPATAPLPVLPENCIRPRFASFARFGRCF